MIHRDWLRYIKRTDFQMLQRACHYGWLLQAPPSTLGRLIQVAGITSRFVVRLEAVLATVRLLQ